MPVVHDDATDHHGDLPGDLPRKAAATHIGHFFAFAAQAGLVSDLHTQAHAEDFAKLERQWFTGRDYVLVALDGRLTDEHLNEEGRAFAAAYYDTGDYRRDYEATLRAHHPTLYHVPDTWEAYALLHPVLERKLAAFRSDPVLPLAAAAAPPPPPPLPAPPASASDMSALPASDPLPLPPPDPLPDGAPPVKAPPPLPPRGSAPRRTRKAARKRGLGAAKWWLLGIVLVFVGVRACGRLVEKQERDRAQFDEFFERMRRENVERHQRMREHADRMRRELNARGRTRSVHRAEWAHLSWEQKDAAKEAGLPDRFENGLGMRFVIIPPGTFVMGSPLSEEGRRDDEEPCNVVVSQPYYMLTTEVSNTLFRRFRSDHRSERLEGMRSFNHGDQPATSVTYEQAAAFCVWLEERDPGRSYRLPTEAEWEYACRAGTVERFWWGYEEGAAGANANVADVTARGRFPEAMRMDVESRPGWQWFETDDGRAGPSVVGSYKANPWALYDMLGNALEWCADWYGPRLDEGLADPTGPRHGVRRVVRGGGFGTAVSETRCASRDAALPDVVDPRVGFRVVSTPRE